MIAFAFGLWMVFAVSKSPFKVALGVVLFILILAASLGLIWTSRRRRLRARASRQENTPGRQ